MAPPKTRRPRSATPAAATAANDAPPATADAASRSVGNGKGKKPAAAAAATEAKSKKPAAAATEEPSVPMPRKKPPPARFVRVWSDADELCILECLAAHVADHGAPPARAELRGLLAGRLPDRDDFTVEEIYKKVRNLMARYHKLRDGPALPPAAARPGDRDAEMELRKYNHSKTIWGHAPPAKAAGGSSAPAAARGSSSEEYPCLAAVVEKLSVARPGPGAVLKRGFELIDDAQAAALDARSKKLVALEVKTEVDGDTLIKEVINSLLKAMD